MDVSSVEELEKKLAGEADKSSATNDRLLLAFFYAKQSDDVKALEQFREALKNDPGNADLWYQKAVVEARTLDFDTALADLEKATKSNPRKEIGNKVAQLQGKLLVRNRQTEKAAEVWQKLIAENPDDAFLAEEVLELQLSEGLYEQAEKLATELIGKTKDPYKKVMRQLRKGDIVQRSGRREKALELYQGTLSDVGSGTWLEREILGQIENVFRREDDLIGLKEHYGKMLKSDSKRLALRQSKARLLIELGLFDDAVAEFKKIVELTPGERSTRESYISALVKAEKFDLAIGQAESLIKQNEDDPELRLKLARLHKQSNADGASEKTAKAIDAFVEVSEKSEYAYLRAARLFDQFKDSENAARMFQACIKAFPESETASESWADHLYRNEKKEQALKIWKSIAGKDCERGKLIRVARLLSSRREHQAAFDLMFERFDDFKLNPGYLGQLCTAAVALKKHEQAVPWVLARVRYSQTVLDLNTCIGQAVQVIIKGEKLDDVSSRLMADKDRSVSETCLLAELLDIDTQVEKADQLLSAAMKKLESTPLADAKANQQANQILAGQQIRILARRKDWTAAAEAAARQVALPGGRKSNNVKQLIQFLLRDGQMEQALTWVGQWKKISPGSLLPWLNESSILDRLDRTDESIRVLRAATRKFPEDIDLHMTLADRYLSKGQYNEAERIYWQQYEEAKNLSDRMRWSRELADAAEEQGEMDELLQKLNERKKNNPQSIEPVLALAEAHRVADNYEERRKALLEATRIQKDNLPLLLQIARLEENEGNWEKALETLERAAALDKTNGTRQRMASVLIQYGETDRGFNMLLDAAGGMNAGPRELEKLASSIIGAGEWDFARRFLQEHRPRYPDDYRLKYLAAITDEQLELTSDATDAFVELLGVSKEISGLKKTVGYQEQQMTELEDMFPPDTYQFMLLSAAEDKAYDYLEDNNRGYRMTFSSGGFSLPQSCEDCQRMAMIHLKSITEDMDEDVGESLAEACRIAGFSNAKLFFGLPEGIDELMADPSQILSENPDDETVLAISVFGLMRSGDMSGEDAVRGYEKFKGRYPELTFLFALQAAGADKSNHSILDGMFESGLELKASSTTLAMVSSYISGGAMYGQAFEHQLSDGQRTKLAKKVRQWYLDSATSQMSPWVFRMIASAVKSEPDGESWIRLLDDELKRSAKSSNIPSQYPTFYSGRRNSGSLVKVPAFPPSSFAAFPGHVASMLSVSNENRIDFFGSTAEQVEPDKWVAKYGPHISKVENPVLRVLLMWKQIQLDIEIEDKSEEQLLKPLQEYLDGLLAAEKPSVDVHLCAAGLACHLQQWEKATNLLEKLRNLPLSRSIRQTVDSALVGIGTQGIEGEIKAAENANIVASAKAAALRLRRTRLDQEQRMQLVAVFETLGLTKEAEKMEDKLTASGSSGLGGMMGRMFGGGASAPRDRVRKLLDSGKKDAAVRLLITEFKGLTQSGLDLNNFAYSEYEVREFRSKIRSLGVQEDFLSQIDPGKSASSTKLALFGYALEVLGKDEEAVKAYAAASGNGKRDAAIRVRKMLLEMKKGVDVSGQFAEFDENVLPGVGEAISSYVSQGDNVTLETKFGLIEAAVEHVVSLPETKSDQSWVMGLVSVISQQQEIGGNEYLPQLYTADGQQVSEKRLKEVSKKWKKRYREFLGKRKTLHDECCEKLLALPQMSTDAFTSLLRSVESAGDVDDERFVKLAVDSILKFKSGGNSG